MDPYELVCFRSGDVSATQKGKYPRSSASFVRLSVIAALHEEIERTQTSLAAHVAEVADLRESEARYRTLGAPVKVNPLSDTILCLPLDCSPRALNLLTIPAIAAKGPMGAQGAHGITQ